MRKPIQLSRGQGHLLNFSEPVLVQYHQPNYSGLRNRVGGTVDDDFKRDLRFEPSYPCENLPRRMSWLKFALMDLGDDMYSVQEIFNECERLNLRPAMYEELISVTEERLSKHLRDEALDFEKDEDGDLRRIAITALGSVTMLGALTAVASAVFSINEGNPRK